MSQTPAPAGPPAPLGRARHGTHLSDPGAQEADAHLPVVVKVGVQAATALGEVAEVGGHGRVDVGELDVKQVEAVLVGGASRALDQGREEVLEGGGGLWLAGTPTWMGGQEESSPGCQVRPGAEKLHVNLLAQTRFASCDSWHKKRLLN